jgi:diguanylate cyclase
MVSFLAHHNLSLNPKNLEQTWEYVCGNNEELKAELNKASVASELNNQSALEIYEKFFNAALDERIEKIFRRAVEQIHSTTQIISTGNENAIQHEKQLIKQADDIRVGKGSLDNAIKKLLELSSLMVESTRENREQISHTNEQLAELQNELEVARSEADHDNLTRLPNRRKFDRDLDAFLHRVQEDELPFVLAFVDVDHFKRINDTFGHQCGDRVLRLVADELSLLSDNRCHIYRYGGEEFAILYEDGDIDDVFPRVDECRDGMANKSLVDVGSGQSIGQVTFSAGLAQCQLSDTKLALLRKADLALYNAKSEGRNLTRIYMSDLEKRRSVDN